MSYWQRPLLPGAGCTYYETDNTYSSASPLLKMLPTMETAGAVWRRVVRIVFNPLPPRPWYPWYRQHNIKDPHGTHLE